MSNNYPLLVPDEVRRAFWQVYVYDATEERYEAFASTWGGLTLEHMRRALANGEEDDRFCAMFALGASILPDAAEVLLPFLQSASREERCVSAIVLGGRKDERAYPFLEALLLEGISLDERLQASQMPNRETLEGIFLCDRYRPKAVELLSSWHSSTLIQTMIQTLKELWALDTSSSGFSGDGYLYNTLCFALGERGVVTAFDEIGFAPAYLKIAHVYFALGHFQVQAEPTFMRAVLASEDLRQHIVEFLVDTFHIPPYKAEASIDAFYCENEVRHFYRDNKNNDDMQEKLAAHFISPWEEFSLFVEGDKGENEKEEYEEPVEPREPIEQIEPSCICVYRGHDLPIFSVSWSSDNIHLVSGSADSTAQVWNWKTRKQVSLFKGHHASVNAVAWSPDGRWIASGGCDNKVFVWEPYSGEVVTTYEQHTNWIYCGLAWSPDGTRLASASWDGMVHIWEALTGKTLIIYRGHHGIVTSVAWSPDGIFLVSGGGYPECAIHVWHATTGQLSYIYRAHMHDVQETRPLLPSLLKYDEEAWGRAASSVRSVAWSPDGQWIASVGLRNVFRVWKAATGEEVLALAQNRTSGPLAWSADSRHVIVGNSNGVDVWNIAQKSVTTNYAPVNNISVTALGWSSDTTMIAAAGEYPCVCVWSAKVSKRSREE